MTDIISTRKPKLGTKLKSETTSLKRNLNRMNTVRLVLLNYLLDFSFALINFYFEN